MENNSSTDDDRQTPSSSQYSSDDMSSVSTETLLPVQENDQRQISQLSNKRISPVNVSNRNDLPNLNIKHPNRRDDDGDDPFNDEKRIINDEHVKVSHISRSALRRLTTAEVPPIRLDTSSRRKSIGNVTVSRGNQRLSQSINDNLNNRQTTQMTSRQSTVRISRVSTAANINQDCNQKVIASKPIVTPVSLVNELAKQKQKDMTHVVVQQQASLNSKKSS